MQLYHTKPLDSTKVSVYYHIKRKKCSLFILDVYRTKNSLRRQKMKITEKQVTAVKRKQGELGLSTTSLQKQLSLINGNFYNIIKGKTNNFYPTNLKKHNDWIIDQYTTLK